MYIIKGEYFKNINELLLHYRESQGVLCCRLTLACPSDLVPFNVKRKYEVARSLIFVEKELGVGQFGTTYLSTYKRQKVFIKALKPNTLPPHLFFIEVLFLVKLDHPNIIKVKCICTDEFPLLIALDYCPEGNLREHLKRKTGNNQLTWKEKVKIARQCASGMQYVEQKKILHRSLQAKNVFLTKGGQCVISGFDLACLLGEPQSFHDMMLQGFRHHNLVSRKHMAPELLKDSEKHISLKSDIWSFGVLCMEIALDGGDLYDDLGDEDLLRALLAGFRLPSPESCPCSYTQMMHDCWELDPEKRPAFNKLTELLKQIEQEVAKC
ncbi:tyrosine-protein kinase HCK-like [Zophobas morio]|uniref:tyrosine-protein kinase HCK-like n=1 Tax=Zophobas morio TaxID=2755281 RepID=UPI003083B480